MPALEYNILKQSLDKEVLTHYPYFVETGTFKGKTIFSMEKHFKELHTIELHPMWYKKARKRYKGNKIHFHLGDSGVKIKEVVKDLDDNTIFFLDSHWSKGNTAEGPKHVPLKEELDAIVTYFKHKAIIIIDDFRLFGKMMGTGKKVNWTDIKKEGVCEIVQSRLVKEYHLSSSYANNDRLILHLNKI